MDKYRLVAGCRFFSAVALICMGLQGAAVADPEAPNGSTTTTTAEAARQGEDPDNREARQNARRERWRRQVLNRYVGAGSEPKLEDAQRYADIFGTTIVYDERYYLYKVKAEAVEGTTGSVRLSGEVYPGHYRAGIAEVFQILGFDVAENSIAMLPELSAGVSPYGVSTTNSATLRSEPRRNAEQVNSVALGGWIRVLREARDADVSSRETGYSRHAPGHDKLPEDAASDWLLVQTMEGYLGFSRKSDFEMRDDYQLPDGMVTLPTQLADEKTTVPAGAFVYGAPDAGWKLMNGAALKGDAMVTDLRPRFSAEEIQELMKPFMNTSYVWGGVTDEGIDCSGFSQFFARTAGAFIPRDSVQQANSGLLVAWGRDVLEKSEPGDLIFFARDNGRISHVAVSLGGSRIIHSAGRGVHISDLKDSKSNTDEAYSEGILFARRVVSR